MKNFTQTILYIAKKTSFGKTEKLLNFPNGSSQKKYCGTAPVNKKAASTNITQLHIRININKKTKNIIIDSDTIRNFIIKKYTKKQEISYIRQKTIIWIDKSQ